MIFCLHWIKSQFRKIHSTHWIIRRTLTHKLWMSEWGATLWLIALWLIERGADWRTGHLSRIPNDSIYEYHPPPQKESTFFQGPFPPSLKLELFSSDFRGCWRVGHLAKLVCLWCSLHESAQGLSASKALDDKSPVFRFFLQCIAHSFPRKRLPE